VRAEAYGHYTNVGLFGGPQRAVGPAPVVNLPEAGADSPITATEGEGASAVYGPATVFGGRWPDDAATAPKSGPVSVSTRGSASSVTATAHIGLFGDPVPITCDGDPIGTANCTAPGGFGPGPAAGDELRSTCTADETGVRGSTTFRNAILSLSTTMEGDPAETEPIPDEPPPNYTREVTINNVGGHPKIIFNEQIVEPDGTITVNAVHMFLRGPIALGEQILGHVRCSIHPAPASATTAVASSVPPASAVARPSSPSPASGPLLPSVLAAVAVAGGLALTVRWARRRRRSIVAGEKPPRED
jgi:hypothetical protein